jgi:NAD(P)H-dependent FMN reductase
MTIKILGVDSSTHEGSYGTRILKTVFDAAEKHETKTRLLNLRSTRMAMFNPDISNEYDEQMKKVIEGVS